MESRRRLDGTGGPLYEPAIACGPVTDFRGEPAPKKGSLPDPFLKGWVANSYLKMRNSERVKSQV
jgi:hypothetical protein